MPAPLDLFQRPERHGHPADAPSAGDRLGTMPMPAPRGPMSTALLDVLVGTGHGDAASTRVLELVVASRTPPAQVEDDGPPAVVLDDDLQLTLACLYELHYRGIEGVDDRWEWHPGLIAVRTILERELEDAVRAHVAVPAAPRADRASVAAALFELAAQDTGPSLSRYVARSATTEQLRELLVSRSLYQLKEADPHTWAIPRLDGPPKAALVEIQSDEYGAGRPERMHAALYAATMRALDLDSSYGAYVDVVPAASLASLNLMSLFGLHRRLRGAAVGHLAAFEMTSSIPNRLYGNGFRRNGFDATATEYFDEHVEADAVHEQIAGRDMAGRLAEQDPSLLPDILLGAAACLAVDGWAGAHLLDAWGRGDSALRVDGRVAVSRAAAS